MSVVKGVCSVVVLCYHSLTLVQEYKVYWVRVAGPVVTLKGSTVSPSIPAPTTSPTSLSAPVSTDSGNSFVSRVAGQDGTEHIALWYTNVGVNRVWTS